MKKQDIIRIINEEIEFALEEQEKQLYKVVDDKGKTIKPDESSDVDGLIKKIATKLAAKNPNWSVEKINEMYDPIYDSWMPEILGMISLGAVGIVKAFKYLKEKGLDIQSIVKVFEEAGLDKQAIVDVIKKAKSQMKGNVNENEGKEKDYTVEYYRTYKNGDEEFETIKVKATSETEAIEKAKEEAPRATRSFKIIK